MMMMLCNVIVLAFVFKDTSISNLKLCKCFSFFSYFPLLFLADIRLAFRLECLRTLETVSFLSGGSV